MAEKNPNAAPPPGFNQNSLPPPYPTEGNVYNNHNQPPMTAQQAGYSQVGQPQVPAYSQHGPPNGMHHPGFQNGYSQPQPFVNQVTVVNGGLHFYNMLQTTGGIFNILF